MKNINKIAIVSIVALLCTTVFFFFKSTRVSTDTMSMDFLDVLIREKIVLINSSNEHLSEDEFSQDVKKINDLTEYCIHHNDKDTIKKYFELINHYFPTNVAEDEQVFRNLNSDNKVLRIYSYKFVQYLLLDRILQYKNALYFKFDVIKVGLFSNAKLNNKELKLGEEYRAYLTLMAGTISEPVKICIEGEKDSVFFGGMEIGYEYVRPSTKKGKQIVKGEATFIINGTPKTFPFKDEYVVE